MNSLEIAIHRRLNLINGENLTAEELLVEVEGMAKEVRDIIKEEIWHDVLEPPKSFGEGVIVLCKNKNKPDGIWLADLIQCWEGKYEPRINLERPVKWTYLEDILPKNEEI
jgi:hypothetical protein